VWKCLLMWLSFVLLFPTLYQEDDVIITIAFSLKLYYHCYCHKIWGFHDPGLLIIPAPSSRRFNSEEDEHDSDHACGYRWYPYVVIFPSTLGSAKLLHCKLCVCTRTCVCVLDSRSNIMLQNNSTRYKYLLLPLT